MNEDDPYFLASSSRAARSTPPALPGRDPQDLSGNGSEKIWAVFASGVVVGVVACGMLYLILRSSPPSGQVNLGPPWPPPRASGDERAASPVVGPRSVATSSNDAPVDVTLSLLPITVEEQPDEYSIKHLTLHIPIKAPPDAHIEVRELVVHVLFYDIVDGQNVVQTSAGVTSHWATPPADWNTSDTEELDVEYRLPKPEAGATRRENRKYFGYIVRVYYRNRLQAAAAEPLRLRQQYPPPPILPK